MSRIACPVEKCPAVTVLDDALEAKYRRTGESWYCPAGHSQFFNAKPDPRDQEIQQLKRQLIQENLEWSTMAQARWAVERQRDAYRAAFRDDYNGPSGVVEGPDGARSWLAPCGAWGHWLDADAEHVAWLLNGHVQRHECGPEIDIEVTA